MSYIDSFNAQRFEASSSSTTIATPPPKPRQSRLRASCDGCFLAKVKCSKARPICARCLACGADCKYSPSSRAGKPRSDGSKGSQTNLNTMASSADVSMAEDPSMASYTVQHPISPNGDNKGPVFTLDTDWSKLSSNESRDRMSRHSLPASLTPSDTSPDGESNLPPNAAHSDFDSFAWNHVSRPEVAPPFLSYHNPNPNPSTNGPLPRSKSMVDVPPALAPWFEGQPDFLPFQHPQGGPMSPNTLYANTMQKMPACTCFATCLQALQALHNGSSPQVVPPFDVVLTVNRRAVESCSMMLNCPKCLSKSGASTSTMLLATVIGKIMSFYRAASQSYFGFNPNPQLPVISPLPLTFGTYRVAGEDGRWLEMEILLRELRKLEELFGKFQETCRKLDMEDDLGVNSALTNYLSQSLHFTYEVLNMQKEASFS